MASKFGGVAVEEKTGSGSRFGGVPIEAPQDGVVSDFIANSPIGAVQGMAEAIRNPSATVKSALSENERLATEAKSAFGSGDYATSARKGANFLLNAMPGLGSALDAASDDFAAGDYARGTAKTLGLASNMLVGKYGPKVMDKATSPATPKPPKPPSKPVTAGGLMEMAKTGKDILQVLKSPNPLTKLSALGRLFEKFASEVTPIESPPAPTVVEAPPPIARGVPVTPPAPKAPKIVPVEGYASRGEQIPSEFGVMPPVARSRYFRPLEGTPVAPPPAAAPTVPPVPAGVEASGPVRPNPQMLPAEISAVELLKTKSRQVVIQTLQRNFRMGYGAASRMVGEILQSESAPPAAVETTQPATPAPSAAGKPVTAATLMEEVAQRHIPEPRPEFDPTNPKAQGKFTGAEKIAINRDKKATRIADYLMGKKLPPTEINLTKAAEALGEKGHPSEFTQQLIHTKMGYTMPELEDLLSQSTKVKK